MHHRFALHAGKGRVVHAQHVHLNASSHQGHRRAQMLRHARRGVQGEAVVHAHPRGEGFKECIICAFADGLRHRPQTTFGNVKTDVLVDQEPGFRPMNFVEVIRKSPWVA